MQCAAAAHILDIQEWKGFAIQVGGIVHVDPNVARLSEVGNQDKIFEWKTMCNTCEGIDLPSGHVHVFMQSFLKRS